MNLQKKIQLFIFPYKLFFKLGQFPVHCWQVFMCQLEGSKHWKLYSPREEGERLPRHSSANLAQEEVSWGVEVEEAVYDDLQMSEYDVTMILICSEKNQMI